MKGSDSETKGTFPFYRGLRFRINLIVFTLCLLIIAVMVLVTYGIGKKHLTNQNYKYLGEFGHAIVGHLDIKLKATEMLALNLANVAAELPKDPEIFQRTIPRILFENNLESSVAGGGIWPEPYAFDPRRSRNSFFWGTNPAGDPLFVDDYNHPDNPPYFSEAWYTPARHLTAGKVHWSGSYTDPYTGEMMVTCTAAIQKSDGFWGTATVDFRLEYLSGLLSTEAETINGYIFAVDQENRFISYPDEHLVLNEKSHADKELTDQFITARELSHKQPRFKPLYDILERIDRGEAVYVNRRNQSESLMGENPSADIKIPLSDAALEDPHVLLERHRLEEDLLLNEPVLTMTFVVPETNWKIVFVMREKAVMKPLNDITLNLLFYMIGFSLIATGIVYLYVRSALIRPLDTMTESLMKIANDEEKQLVKLPDTRKDELGSLAYWFNKRTDSLAAAHSKLKEEEERFQLFMDHLPAAVFIRDTDARLMYINRYLKEMIGKNHAWAGKTLEELFPGEAGHDIGALTEAVLREGYNISEDRMIDNKGEKRTFSTHRFLIERQGRAPLVGGISMDVTDSKRAEEEQKRLQTALQQSRKMEAIGSLAGGIAHDFNNILTAISGFTELSLMEIDSESPIAGNLQNILNASFRARDLIYQILTFSRQGEQKPKLIEPGLIVKEALRLIRASLPAAIEIVQEYQSRHTVMADPTGIHQIIMNLCSNAAHAMKESGGTLTVRLSDATVDEAFAARHPELVTGDYVKLEVGDTGTGIPANTLERIFDPFFTTKKQGEGTGMGLSVIHGIVKNLGGAILVYSEENMGTTFNVFFPAYEGDEDQDTLVEQSFPTGKERILFVDDEEILAEVGMKQLESLGYTVSSRTSPLEAFSLFEKNPDHFDLVITDLNMPKMNGLALAGKITRIRNDIPVILCSGFTATLEEKQIKSAGIRFLVKKPVLRSDIAVAVRSVLDGLTD